MFYQLITFMLLLFALSNGVDNEIANTSSKKLGILKRGTGEAGSILRSLNIISKQDRAQLISIANSFRGSLNNAIYTFNTFIPSAVADKSYNTLVSTAKLISTMVTSIQTAIPLTAKDLQTKLAETLDNISTATAQFDRDFKSYNPFILNQLDKKYDDLVIATYKVKAEASLYHKSNAALEIDIETSTSKLIELVKALPNNEITEEKLRRVIDNIAISTSRNVYRLKNWVEVNAREDNEAQTVQGVVEDLSEVFGELNRPARKSQRSPHLKSKVVGNLKTIGKQLTKLSLLENSANSVASEFIRSSLFDGASLGDAIAALIAEVVSEI